MDYKCPVCGTIKEELGKLTDTPPKCHACKTQLGAPTIMVRQPGVVNFQLKGKGFYKPRREEPA